MHDIDVLEQDIQDPKQNPTWCSESFVSAFFLFNLIVDAGITFPGTTF